MTVDAIVGAVAVTSGLLLAAAASSVIVAPGRFRRSALALAPGLRRVGSTALRRTLRTAGVLTALVGAAVIARPTHPLTATTVTAMIATMTAIGTSRRVRWARPMPHHRRRVPRPFAAVRARSARRRALLHVRRTVDDEIDRVVQEYADLAWWAATVRPGSVSTDGLQIAAHTVVVPGRHGELSAVVPASGTLTLLLLTSTGPVDGVSVCVAI